MDDKKLIDRLIKNNTSDEEALGFIFSNYIDIGGNLVGLTVKNAIKAGKLLREYDKMKNDSNDLSIENKNLKNDIDDLLIENQNLKDDITVLLIENEKLERLKKIEEIKNIHIEKNYKSKIKYLKYKITDEIEKIQIILKETEE
jgi:hypothetical protein